MSENPVYPYNDANAPKPPLQPDPPVPQASPQVAASPDQPHMAPEQVQVLQGADKQQVASILEKPPKVGMLSFLSGRVPYVIGGIIILLLLVGGILLALNIFSKKTPEQVTLTYWGLFEDQAVMDGVIKDFQRENPEIKVNYVKKDILDYRESLVTQISANNGPDIYRFHNSWTGMMKSYLAPLSQDVIATDDFKKNYYPVVQEDMVRDGALYGLPIGIDTLALFINTEVFQATGYPVPKTWDEFTTIAKESTVKDQAGVIKTAGASIGTYDNVAHASDIVSLLMVQNGTSFNNFSSTQKQASEALIFYRSFAQGGENVWDANQENSLTAFSKGRVGMYVGYSWDIFSIKAANPELNFTTHPVPNLPERKVALASYWSEGISSKSRYPKESMKFLSYLSKKETLEKLYKTTSSQRLFGQLYPRSDMAGLLMSDPLLSPFVEQMSYATSTYFASETHDEGINEQMNGYLGNAVRSQVSVQSAVETLAQGVSQVLSKYGR